MKTNAQKKQSDCPCCGQSGEKFDDASNFEDKKHRYHCSEKTCPVEMFVSCTKVPAKAINSD